MNTWATLFEIELILKHSFFSEITCPILNDVINADVVIEHEGHAAHLPPYDVGDTLIYTCDEGYMAQGSTTLECKENGQWSYPLPRCIG